MATGPHLPLNYPRKDTWRRGEDMAEVSFDYRNLIEVEGGIRESEL